MIKVTRTFDLVKTRTSKKVAMRKNWTKFGLSKGDSKGPQDSTTIIAEEVTMRFIHADQKAIDAMNGYGYDHLILSVEWSENRKKDAESTDKPSGYQSRVRKH